MLFKHSKYIMVIFLFLCFIIISFNFFSLADEKDTAVGKEDGAKERTIYYKITAKTINNLKTKIADDKLEIIGMLKNYKFSKEEITGALTQLGLTEGEIQIILDEAMVEGQTEEEKAAEASPVDIGNINGKVMEVFEVKVEDDVEKRVKINVGLKQGLDGVKDIEKIFIVKKKNIPVAMLSAVTISENESECSIEEELPGFYVTAGDDVTSEINEVDHRDLVFMDNPYCEFLDKTAMAGGNNFSWHLEPVTSDLMGRANLLMCYGHNDTISSIAGCFGLIGKGIGSFTGSKDTSFIYLINEKGEKKWGYMIDMCIFKLINSGESGFLMDEKPDYKIYSDKLYFNTFNMQKTYFGSGGYRITSGVLFGMDMDKGKELWRLKDTAFSYDPVLYSIIYDNFIDKICYLYSSQSSLYAVNLTNGEFIWEFRMHKPGVEKGTFDEKGGFLYAVDGDNYFYRVDSKTGTEQWNFKADATVVKTDIVDEEKIIYLFDSNKSVYALNLEKGTLIWKYDAEKSFTAPFRNHRAGDLIYTYDNNSIVVLSRSGGKILWKLEMDKPLPLDYTVTDTLYCISDKNNLCAVEPSKGTIKWKYQTKKDITRVFPVKDTFYILDEKNIYALDKVSGKELWQKNDISNPRCLEKPRQSIDPYNIMELGKVENESALLFIIGDKEFVTIDPVNRKILSEQKALKYEVNKDTVKDLIETLPPDKLKSLESFVKASVEVNRDTLEDIKESLSPEKLKLVESIMQETVVITTDTLDNIKDDLPKDKLKSIVTLLNRYFSEEELIKELTDRGFNDMEKTLILDESDISYDSLPEKDIIKKLTEGGFNEKEVQLVLDKTDITYEEFPEQTLNKELAALGFNEKEIQSVLDKSDSNDYDFIRVLSDQQNYYIASMNYLWAVDIKTGNIKWGKNFDGTIIFIPTPADGEVCYNNFSLVNKTNTVMSRSKKLISVISRTKKIKGSVWANLFRSITSPTSRNKIYILNKETGDIVQQKSERDFLYPYMEMEAMNKIGEETKGIYYYYDKGSLYTLKAKTK